MGSSQSKRERERERMVDQGRRLEQDSIKMAIEANKRQRKQLLKQARQASANGNLTPALMFHDGLVMGELDDAGNGDAFVFAAKTHRAASDHAISDCTASLGNEEPRNQHKRHHQLHLLELELRNEERLANVRQCKPQPLAYSGYTSAQGATNHQARSRNKRAYNSKAKAPRLWNKFQAQSANATAFMAPTAAALPSLASRQMSRETLLASSKGFRCQQSGYRCRQEQLASSFEYQATASLHNIADLPTNTESRSISSSSTSQYSSKSSSTSSTGPTYPLNLPSVNSKKLQGPTNHRVTKKRSSQIVYQARDYPRAQMSSMCFGDLSASRQRGLAFSELERKRLRIAGLLPGAVQDQGLQVRGVMNFIESCEGELNKYLYLRNLKDFNERLFYAALEQNVEKLMPIVYTPTVGLACQKFSHIYMRPRGLFVTAKDAGQVGSLLANWPEKDVRVIVVTDGERILGLGDLGANGMGISIGKLSLYTALAGIPPQNVLPVTIDVGTNNQALLEDPFYIGLRQNRLRGQLYESLIEEFMKSVVTRWGRSTLIQFEDFANSTAFSLLQRYRNHYCTFNDDIQGTASVCLSGLISAAKLIERKLTDCSFLFYGAGEANLGTANLLMMAMRELGASSDEAQARIWLVDSKGLIVSSRTDLNDHKRAFARDAPQTKDLEDIISYAKPLAIIGASAQGGAFTESICRKMAQFNERPIIFALSNPTSKAECTADQAYRWTEGRCVFASGSPFEPVSFGGKTYVTGQGNNAYIFPGVGLAAIAAHVHTIPEETFLVAARALSDQLSADDASVGLIYPRLSKIRQVTLMVATRVLEYFYSERLATYRPEPNDKLAFLESIQYNSSYQTELEPMQLDKLSLNNVAK